LLRKGHSNRLTAPILKDMNKIGESAVRRLPASIAAWELLVHGAATKKLVQRTLRTMKGWLPGPSNDRGTLTVLEAAHVGSQARREYNEQAHWWGRLNTMTNIEATRTRDFTKAISPAQHAVLDYSVAATFLALGFSLLPRHRSAAALALINGTMVLGMSLLTDYPGGVMRRLSFRAHRTGDIAQAALAGLGPILFGFGNHPDAKYFYGQALSEAGVIAATDWEAAWRRSDRAISLKSPFDRPAAPNRSST
jgi:hypothetical protein